MPLDPHRLQHGFKGFDRNKPFDLDTIVKFGKYKGYTVLQILEENARYIEWCCENIDWFKLTKRANDEVEHYIEEQTSDEDAYWEDEW